MDNTMTTFNALPINVPSDLALQLDKRAGDEPGTVMGILTNVGMLHEKENALMAIAMTPVVLQALEQKDLDKKTAPMSLERFSNVLWFAALTYSLGLITFRDGKVDMGSASDYAQIALFQESDTIKFRSGKEMDTDKFKMLLIAATGERVVDDIYKDIVKTNPVTRKKSIPSKAEMFAAVMATFEMADKIMS